MSFAQSLDTLQRAYDKQGAKDTLNTAMRRALRQHAAAVRLQFRQDSVGNIYIGKNGRDVGLADIAIAFPLDTHESSQCFTSAFRVYNHLANEDLVCGLTLMGYTSINGKDVGLDQWETSATVQAKFASSTPMAVLEQFSQLPSPSDFSFSALFIVAETRADGLRLHGSPLLIAKAQEVARDQNGVRKSMRASPRTPGLLIEGDLAEAIAQETICKYSEYIAALFDNFE